MSHYTCQDELFGLLHRKTENSHKLLPILDLEHPLLNAILDDESVDLYLIFLSHPMNSVDSLCLNREAPPRVHHVDSFGAGQVEADTTGLQAEEENRELL